MEPQARAESRIVITLEGIVYTFMTNKDGKAVPKSLTCLYTPKKDDPAIYIPYKWPGKPCDNYLDIDTSTSNEMLPCHYVDGKKRKIRTTLDFDIVRQMFGNDATFYHTPVNGTFKNVNVNRIDRIDTVIGKGNWNLRYANFKFHHLSPNTKVEYALSIQSFIRICKKYMIDYMFREYPSRVALDNTNGTTDLLYGTYDGFIKCRVKRVLATTVGGYYFFSLMLQRLCNEHENMVRIYEIRFDGEHYQIAMENCGTNFNELLKHRFKDASRYEESKRFLWDVLGGIIHIHDKNTVHRRIRPHNILSKEDSATDRLVPKLGGMSQCQLCPKMLSKSHRLFTRDLYDMGRNILARETEHEFPDDDAQAERCYQSKEMFKGDTEELLKRNPMAHDLVEKLFASVSKQNITARQASLHYYFWKEGMYLDFMERAWDAMTGQVDGIAKDHLIKRGLIRRENKVFNDSWASQVDEQWLNKMKLSHKYEDTRIIDLLKLICMTSHYLADQLIWDIIGVTPNGFEKYILTQFPNLFPNVYDAVVESGNETFKDFFEESCY